MSYVIAAWNRFPLELKFISGSSLRIPAITSSFVPPRSVRDRVYKSVFVRVERIALHRLVDYYYYYRDIRSIYVFRVDSAANRIGEYPTVQRPPEPNLLSRSFLRVLNHPPRLCFMLILFLNVDRFVSGQRLSRGKR